MLNSVILMGRLTADPELRTTANNISVVSFTMAVPRSYVRAGEERQTDFVNIVAWRKNAEFVSKYFKKGSLIAVRGSIQSRSYEDKNRNKRTAIEVIADEISFCGRGESFSEPQKDTDEKGLPITNEIVSSVDDLPF